MLFRSAFSQGGQSYLGSAEVEVGFANNRKITNEPYDQDELAKQFIKVMGLNMEMCAHSTNTHGW